MRISKLLSEKRNHKIIDLPEDTSVKEAAKLMCKEKIGVILAYRNSNDNQEKNYTGILSDSDIISSICKYDDITKIRISELMTKNLIVAHENDSLQYALNVMIKNKISHLPIVSDKKLITVISIKDLIPKFHDLQ